MANKRSDDSASPLNSFIRRGPNKRQIRAPENPQIFHLNMAGSDSEEDEDFVAFSDEDSNSSDASDHRNVQNADQEDDYSSSDQEDNQNDKKEELDQKHKDPVFSIPLQESIDKPDERRQQKFVVNQEICGDVTASFESTTPKVTKKPDVLVCGICLESESTEEDELVECDHCGITVHEGCFGDTEDSVSESKSDSDAATEPWFCDLCKAQANGICELCPNKGGIMKQTDTGRWVHLICALYVPGIGFGDVDKLQMVVLDDIATSRWGARWCMLCEDQRFSRTGVCIACDAGLCKNHFHAICAQKHGLLIEIPDAGHLDDEEADPLYAHCKAHTDKDVMKSRKKSWLAFQAHVDNFKISDDQEEKARIDAAFERACKEYEDFVKSIPLTKPITENKPRLLSTCPEVCESLIRKAELLGGIKYPEAHDTEIEHVEKAARGGAMFKPNLSVGFINHFFKREKWLQGYEEKHKNLQENIANNQNEQKLLQETWDNMKINLEKLSSGKEKLVSELTRIHTALESMMGGKLMRPRVLSPKKKVKQDKYMSLKEIIHVCANCKGEDNQQLMATCDKCKNYYHIHCLDPPLSHLPKKGSNWIWHCTDCDESESSEESVDLDEPIAKRKKRISSAPKKFTPVEEEKQVSGKKCGRVYRGGRPPKQKDVSSETPESAKSNGTPATRGRKRVKVEEIFDNCSVCSNEGNYKNMVSCDECLKSYHFECCIPKLKANPKRRGYSWICTECTGSSEEENDDDNDDNCNDHSNDKTNDIVKQADVINDNATEIGAVSNNIKE